MKNFVFLCIYLWNTPQPALSPNQMQKQKSNRLQKSLEDGGQGRRCLHLKLKNKLHQISS
jgi:hypothetical protein